MEEIYTRLYVGGDADYERVKGKEGWSWLRCAKYGPDGHKELLGYTTMGAPPGPNYLFFRKNKHLMALNILDIDDPNMVPFECIVKGLDFVKERLDSGDKVLVCCNSGHSRGPSTGLAFLRSIGEMPHNFHMSERVYHTIYRNYDPGLGIRQVLRSHWAELDRMELTNA
jgi:hypothetical protein